MNLNDFSEEEYLELTMGSGPISAGLEFVIKGLDRYKNTKTINRLVYRMRGEERYIFHVTTFPAGLTAAYWIKESGAVLYISGSLWMEIERKSNAYPFADEYDMIEVVEMDI